MKHLTLLISATITLLSPLSAKTYGGFEPGKTFTFTVVDKLSKSQVDLNSETDVPVPPGILNLAVGSKVTFTIGKKGQLQFKKVSFPFDIGKKGYNQYLLPPADGLSKSGLVYKNTKGEPKAVSLNYLKFVTDGASRTTFRVDYKLK
jgi:hypothetical protein